MFDTPVLGFNTLVELLLFCNADNEHNCNYSHDTMFQCEVWPGHPASGGYSVHAPPAAGAVSPEEEGGVGGGLEPGRVQLSPLTQPGVQQLPAGTS